MLEAALKLSDSRLLLLGATAIDTVGMGTLAVLLTMPAVASSSTLMLIALAATTPVLALTTGVSAALVSKSLQAEERARRAILAGTILHMGVQAGSLVPMLCGCGGPSSFRAYVLHTTLTAAGLAALSALTVAFVRRRKSNAKAARSVSPPESEL